MEYFAALPAVRLAPELIQRKDSYYNWILSTGRLGRWRIAYDNYYGQTGQHNSSHVTSGGEKGELSFLKSNEYRNLVQHLLVLAFQSRPAIETVAINTDSKSKAATYIAKGIVEYFRRDGKIDDNNKDATEISLVMDVGWTFNEWNVAQGEDIGIDPDTKKVARAGGIKSRAKTPLDVAIDFTRPQGYDRDWILVRDAVNKYDLAAQYPDKADEIIGYQRDQTQDAIYRFGDNWSYDEKNLSSDIDVWTFYHRKSPALPQGRMFQFATATLTFFDGPIPYRKLPGNRICPSEQILSSLGYSNANDLLGLQAVVDAMISAAVTNMTSMGVNTIWSKPNQGFDFNKLAEGMAHVESETKPEVLIMNQLSPQWIAVMNFVIARMEAISGVNAVARGNIEGENLSGAAMALLQSMAIQFNNGLVRAVNRLTEDSGNDIIQLTQDFVKEPQLGMIVGTNNMYMLKEYSGKDLKPIQRVYCRQSNPMKDTTAGKMQLLETYMKIPGCITSPGQVTEVLETGQLDSSTERDRNQLLAIDKENEDLINGGIPTVVFTDNHVEHMKRHVSVFSSPQDRKDPELMARARSHYQQHILIWQQTDPGILQGLGIPPYQPGLAPMPPGPEGAPPPPGAGGEGITPVAPNGAEPPQEVSLPKNPLSGQEFDPATGGLPTQGAVNA
jgi:hypothetical protein